MKKRVTCLIWLAVSPVLLAQDGVKPKRAQAPNWGQTHRHIFFQNAFSEGLVGSRPSTLGDATKVAATPAGGIAEASKVESSSDGWSAVVSAQSLEDEVKAIHIQMQRLITTPGKYQGGGHQDGRRLATVLGTLFAVIHEYDRDVRWKKDAAEARNRFLRWAANSKPSSIQAFREAQKRKDDLEELVRGGSLIQGEGSGASWDVINRRTLMQRFTQCFDDGLVIWTANDNEFQRRKSDIVREAELLMMLSKVLTQPGMEEADDEEYAAYAQQLQKAAQQVLNAARDGNAESARRASSDVGQSCVACHDDYRG